MRTGEHNGPLPAPPAPFLQTSPSTLEVREGGGCMAVFGVPFFLAGVFLGLTATGLVPMQSAPAGTWVRVLLAVMSLVFLAVGGGLVFGRRWLTLDLGSGSVIRSQGLLVPMHHQERRLNEFTAVVLAFNAGDSDSADRYPVSLRALTGKDVVVTSAIQFGEAREHAEFLSRSLRLPLADTITDHETVVSPDRAGETLLDRLQSARADAARVAPPPEMRCEVSASRSDATIVIPGGKGMVFGGFASLLPVVMLIFVIPWLLRFFARTSTPTVVQYIFVAAMILMFGIPALIGSVNLMVGSHRKKTTVKASPAGLVIERQDAWRSHTQEVSAADILDVDLSTFASVLPPTPEPGTERIIAAAKRWAPTKGIIVKSRQALITFGEGLPAGELQYLNWLLRKALTSR